MTSTKAHANVTAVTAGTTAAPPRRSAPAHRAGAAAVVLPAHGGSAATTVARLLKLPQLDDPAAAAGAALVVVTARSTATGMADAVRTIGRLPDGTPVLLVVSADAPLRMPPAARASLRLLADRATAVTLPYVPAWRYGPPSPGTASKRWRQAARTALTHVRTLTSASAPGGSR